MRWPLNYYAVYHIEDSNVMTSSPAIFLSVIVPVYNIKDYLTKCIDSILAQEVSSMELILVDDGSNDGSEYECDRLASSDRRITVIHKCNGGVNTARNAGLTVAKGKYITFVDGDDFIKEGTFNLVIDVLENYPEIDLLQFPEIYVVNGKGTIRDGYPDAFLMLNNQQSIMAAFLGKVPAPFRISGLLWGKFYSSRIWKDLSLREDMRLCEDYYVMPDILERCRFVVSIPTGGYCYLMRDGSASHSEYTLPKRIDVFRAKTKLYSSALKYNINPGGWWNEATYAAIDAYSSGGANPAIRRALKMLQDTRPAKESIPPYPKRVLKLARWLSPYFAAQINKVYNKIRGTHY